MELHLPPARLYGGAPFPVLKKIKENDRNFKKLNPLRCPCIMPSSFNENLKT
jgi:hypothetical protein